jgi:glycine cleavage system H protein
LLKIKKHKGETMVALFVLLTFILFIVIDLLVLKAQKKTHPAFEPSYLMADRMVFANRSINVPEGIYLSKGHTWAVKNDTGFVKVGIDDFILKTLGKLTIKKFAEPGVHIKRGDVLFEGGFGSRTFKFRSPVDGIVKFVNSNLLGKNINDPYGEDWGVLLSADQFDESRKSLLSGKELSSWMKKEFARLKDFLGTHAVKPQFAGVTMQDGGNIVEGALASITEEGLNEFEEEFLSI